LALLKKREYGRAGVHMAPVIWGDRQTMDQMFWYTLILVPLTLLPAVAGAFGVVYLACALILGLTLLAGVVRVRRAREWAMPAWSVYKFSLVYLALLFVAMAVDRRLII
jgi:protoheme IX farnesyltransferase